MLELSPNCLIELDPTLVGLPVRHGVGTVIDPEALRVLRETPLDVLLARAERGVR